MALDGQLMLYGYHAFGETWVFYGSFEKMETLELKQARLKLLGVSRFHITKLDTPARGVGVSWS